MRTLLLLSLLAVPAWGQYAPIHREGAGAVSWPDSSTLMPGIDRMQDIFRFPVVLRGQPGTRARFTVIRGGVGLATQTAPQNLTWDRTVTTTVHPRSGTAWVYVRREGAYNGPVTIRVESGRISRDVHGRIPQ